MIPYGRQSISEDDILAVTEVLRGDWLTTGPAVEAFERAFAQKTGALHAVACANGTAALHLALLAGGIGKGSRVIVPANTFLATANAVILAGGEVVIADVDPDTGLMTSEHAEEAISRAAGNAQRVHAIIPVHFAGQSDAPEELRALANRHRLTVIEDACHAVGTSYQVDGEWYNVGACAHAEMTCFSFHPVKTMTTAEGGMITCTDKALADRLRELRNHGMVRTPERFENADLGFDSAGIPNPWYYELQETGLNYRLCDLQCALGLSQLKRLELFIKKRGELVNLYRREIAGLEPFITPLRQIKNCTPGWHLFVALLDFPAIGMERGAFMEALRKAGVGTQVHYIPLHQQPFFARRYGNIELPGAEAYYGRCLSLPLFPDMSDEDARFVCESLRKLLKR